MKTMIKKTITYFLAGSMLFAFNACKSDGINGASSVVNLLAEGEAPIVEPNIPIVDLNKPPVANIGVLGKRTRGDVIVFDGSASTDEDGEIVKYEWDIPFIGKREGIEVTVIIPEDMPFGRHEVKLTVTDDDNSTNSATGIFVIISLQPA